MIIVLDTCAAVEVVLKRKKAATLRKHLADAELVLAPDLFVFETINVFWKYHALAGLPLQTCEDAVDRTLLLPDEYVSGRDFYKEAFALACLTGKTAYDMSFLVLARRNNACLMTIDKKLQTVAKKQSIRTIYAAVR